MSRKPNLTPNQPGPVARSSGVVPSFADIQIEMNWLQEDDNEDRRRWLRSWGRSFLDGPQID